MNLLNFLERFLSYLQIEKNYSEYTIESYKINIEEFFQFMTVEGIKLEDEITYSDVRLYLTSLHQRKLSRRSVALKVSSLRSFFKFLMRENTVMKNPFMLASLPKKELAIPNFFYEEELSSLFEVSDLNSPLGIRNQAILELLYSSGIRVSECCGLELQDIDFQLGVILVLGKGSKERYVPFGNYAHDSLIDYLENARPKLLTKGNVETNAVFLNNNGTPLTPRGIRYILAGMMKKSSLMLKINPHKLRHTFATHMLDEGADIRVVQELLGHENLSTTQIYTHVSKERLRSVYMLNHPRAKK